MANAHDKPAYQNPFESTRSEEIAPLVGKHIFSTYADGWQYEVYR